MSGSVFQGFGDLMRKVGGSPFRFTGEQLDDNGLLYLRARYYHPELGVFTGLDPVENLNRYQYVSANPVNDAVGELGWMNGYAYVNGNPTNLTDPSGMIAESPEAFSPCTSAPQRQTPDCSCYAGTTIKSLCGAKPPYKLG